MNILETIKIYMPLIIIFYEIHDNNEFFFWGMISAMMRISFKIKLKNSKVGKTYNEWYPSKEEIEY